MSSRFSVLRHRDFRRLWLAQSGSVLGDRIVLVAMALYVTDLTGSASDLGIVLTAHALPLVGLLLIGGVWADRLPKQRLLLATDVVRGVIQAVVAALVLLEVAEVWQLAVAGVLFGAAEAFARPAHEGVIPETVPDGEVQEARALVTMTTNAADLGGPAVATVLVITAGAGGAFAVDAATFFVSAALLAGVRTRDRVAAAATPPEPSVVRPSEAAPSWRAELAEGWHEVRSRQWVWVIILGATAGLLLALAPLYVLGPSAAEEHYGDSAVYGWVITAFGAGAVTGAVTGMRWRPRRPLLAAQLLAVPWPLVGATLGLGAPLAVVIALAIAGGWAVALFDVLWTTALAERIPPGSLARVSSFDWMGSLALLPLGYAVAGPLADVIGTTEVLAGGAALTIVTSLCVALSPDLRRIERLPARHLA